jgi:Predicted membrane protein
VFHQSKIDFTKWIFVIGIILFIAELLFFNGEALFFLMMMIFCVYIGRKRMPKKSGLLLFWIGIIGGVLSFFNMFTFRLLLFAVFIYFIFHYVQNKQVAAKKSPKIEEADPILSQEETFSKTPLFQNRLFGTQRTEEQIYKWNDVNIQTGIGDTVIDLNYTILPKGEAVIVIRKLIGNIEIIVPYELEVSVHHSGFIGSYSIFDYSEPNVWNETIRYESKNYHESAQKVKIITSITFGRIEVKRT